MSVNEREYSQLVQLATLLQAQQKVANAYEKVMDEYSRLAHMTPKIKMKHPQEMNFDEDGAVKKVTEEFEQNCYDKKESAWIKAFKRATKKAQAGWIFKNILLTLLALAVSTALCFGIFLLVRIFVSPIIALGVALIVDVVAMVLICRRLWSKLSWSKYHYNKAIDKDNTDFTKKDYDYSKLYETEEYQKACQTDRLNAEKKRASYQKAYEKACATHQEQLKIHEQKLKDYQQRVLDAANDLKNNINAQIKASTVLHDDQKNLDMIYSILYWMEHNYADTIKEALNLILQEDRHQEMTAGLNKIASTVLQVGSVLYQQNQEAFNRLQQDNKEIKQKVDEVMANIDNNSKKIFDEINELNKNVETTCNLFVDYANDKNAEIEDLNKEISGLNYENSRLQDQINELKPQ